MSLCYDLTRRGDSGVSDRNFTVGRQECRWCQGWEANGTFQWSSGRLDSAGDFLMVAAIFCRTESVVHSRFVIRPLCRLRRGKLLS